jgi:molybdopterin molybdotransferase
MKSVDEHRADVAAAVPALAARPLGLDEADGAVLAEEITARWPLPGFDNSAMDGYAVLARDVAAAAPAMPVLLPVEAEIAAGDTEFRTLAAGTCMRIMTGAPLPAGADAVVRVEWTDGGTRKAAIRRPVAPGDSVRRCGCDAQPGAELLTAGTRLGPAQLGLLAAVGEHTVLARPRPRIAILSAGNELTGPGGAPRPGHTWESNSFMLAAAARRLDCPVRRCPLIRDDPAEVRAAVQAAAHDADLLITSGGISMGGEHDVFKAALQGLDGVTFDRVAMRPGMPQGFGAVGEPPTPILLLPGNPASAFVSFWLFAAPAVRARQGLAAVPPRTTRAVLTAPVRSRAGKTSFAGGLFDPATGEVTPAAESSHHLTALAQANALIIVPSPVTALAAGDQVEVLELPA